MTSPLFSDKTAATAPAKVRESISKIPAIKPLDLDFKRVERLETSIEKALSVAKEVNDDYKMVAKS